ncbi:MAG: 33 kDa chaperonin [Rhodothalassiaceae bacterium]|nr:MAG: 33 kDa chaperonin [Rhodothalassiaceae bacterium]
MTELKGGGRAGRRGADEGRPADRPIVVAATEGADDRVRPFALERAPVRGRIVRLGPVLDEILALHDYPPPLARQLARLAALTALLGSMVKTDGRVTVQARGGEDAPLAYMVADCTLGREDEPAGLRAYASVRADHDLVAGGREADLAAWVGERGDLAITLEFTRTGRRYQGIVPVEAGDLAAAAEHYFDRSEQIPTRVKLAAERHAPSRGWRAGGLLIQHMPADGGRAAAADPDAWPRARMLFETASDAELLDPALGDDALLYRLFHEEGVRVFAPVALVHRCGCSAEKLRGVLAQFSQAERAEMCEADGLITAVCQYCGRRYRFHPDEITGAARA